MEAVEIAELGRVSVVTLMLKQVLDTNLQDPRKKHVMRNRMLVVQIRVREMVMTLFFEANRVRAEEGARSKPDIEISGDMGTLLSVALGASPIAAFFRRKLKIRFRRFRGYFHIPRLLLMMQLGKPPAYLRWLSGRPPKEAKQKGALPAVEGVQEHRE